MYPRYMNLNVMQTKDREDLKVMSIRRYSSFTKDPLLEPHYQMQCRVIIFTNPSVWAGYDTRSIFKRSLTGLNSEFSFS